MHTALLLHWLGWRSNGSWFPWLQTELNSRLFDVYTPNLPSSDNPILEQQKEYIDIYAPDFNEWWYIIGHSLWAQLAMNFVEENEIKNSTIILVGPSYPWLAEELGREVFGESYDYLERYYDTKIDFEKMNNLGNMVVVFLSDDDPFINLENAKEYYSHLKNIEIKEFQNKGHFNTGAWVTELKEILDYIESEKAF